MGDDKVVTFARTASLRFSRASSLMTLGRAASLKRTKPENTDDDNDESIENLRTGKSRKTSYCCKHCSGESSRRAGVKLEKLLSKVRVEDSDHADHQDQLVPLHGQGGGERAEVGLHVWKSKLVITVNAPADFVLSLDHLPCFQMPVQIAGSSNGLLLCSTGRDFQYQHYQHYQHYVCNPLTKQWMALPRAPDTRAHVSVGFIYDPCNHSQTRNMEQQKLLHCSECKFRVVRLSCKVNHFSYRSEYLVETFSSNTSEWTTATVRCSESRWSLNRRHNDMPVFHNECLHWLGNGANVLVYDPYRNKLLGCILRPSYSETCQTNWTFRLGLSRGSLWLCQFSGVSGYFRFWKLNGYDYDDTGKLHLDECSWSPHRLCNWSDMITSDPRWKLNSCDVQFIAIHPQDPDIIYLELSTISGKYVISCNLSDKSLGQTILKSTEAKRGLAETPALVLTFNSSPTNC